MSKFMTLENKIMDKWIIINQISCPKHEHFLDIWLNLHLKVANDENHSLSHVFHGIILPIMTLKQVLNCHLKSF